MVLKTQFCFVFKQKSPPLPPSFQETMPCLGPLKPVPLGKLLSISFSFYLKILKLRQRLELGYL